MFRLIPFEDLIIKNTILDKQNTLRSTGGRCRVSYHENGIVTVLSIGGGYLPTYFVDKKGMNPYIGRMRAMLDTGHDAQGQLRHLQL